MIKRILVAIGEKPASRVAQDLAIAIAKRRGAALTGLGVVDRLWATAPQAVPIGGSAYKVHRDQAVLEQLRHEVEAILRAFSEACRNAGVPAATVEAEDLPAKAIESEAEGCDLIVIGKGYQLPFLGRAGHDRNSGASDPGECTSGARDLRRPADRR
jgi:nucleotide-binding universal stress UspA family protein